MIEKSDQDWIREALVEARQVVCDIPVGALVVKQGKILGRGHNLREETNDPTAHAEIIAIRAAAANLGCWRLTGSVLYTTLEPCPMCAEAIIQSRLSKLVFGAYDARSGAAGSAFNLFCPGRIYPLPEVVAGVFEEQCQQLLVNHFRSGGGGRGSAGSAGEQSSPEGGLSEERPCSELPGRSEGMPGASGQPVEMRDADDAAFEKKPHKEASK